MFTITPHMKHVYDMVVQTLSAHFVPVDHFEGSSPPSEPTSSGLVALPSVRKNEKIVKHASLRHEIFVGFPSSRAPTSNCGFIQIAGDFYTKCT